MNLELKQEQVPVRPSFRSLDDVIKEHVLWVLDANKGNKTKTAAALGVPRATFYRWLRSWGIK